MNLVIVESPAKCSKIKGFLGPGWEVLASMGHIRRLVEDLKGLHIEDGFKPEYEFMKEKGKTILQLKKAAVDCKNVYLASDDDREGEAISYSIAIALHLNISTNPRIVFHEITKDAVLNAIKKPTTINMNRVNSQQARSVLDLMVGFTISPLLWKHVGKGLSAGRCQTPALRIIVEREKDIKNFSNQMSWCIKGAWRVSPETSQFSGTMIDELEDEESVINYLENVYNELTATICSVTTKPTVHNPPLPLITSSLQQEASALYGMNPKSTMKIAQTLYESGYITYMRTDNATMSEDAIKDASKIVSTKYGKDYLKDSVVKAKSSTIKPQEAAAHECIRPTHFETTTLPSNTSEQERKIYTLIYKRALQSVMASAKGDERKIQWSIDNDPNNFVYEAVWKRTTFQGWKIVGMSEAQLDEKEEDEQQAWVSSQHLCVGTKIQWTNLVAQQKFTNASPRYNEATLVRELEKKGIGRPSTFASLVNAIVDKSYVEIKPEEKKEIKVLKYSIVPDVWPPTKLEELKQINSKQQKMVPTILGVQVYEFCVKEFNELFDYGFTKRMEDKLDEVEKGTEIWQNVCKSTYDSYKDKYIALQNMSSVTIRNDKKTSLSNGYEAFIGPWGPCLVKDKKFLGWPDGVEFKNITDTIVEEFILKGNSADIFGYYEEKPLVRKKGKFGEYIVYDGNNIALKSGDTVEDVIERMKGKSETLHTLNEFVFKKGPYGTYMMKTTPVAKGKKPAFVSIPSGIDVKLLTYEAAKTIYETDVKKPKKFYKK